jgi:hypothetical protein
MKIQSRPFRVTLIAVLTLSIALWNGLRLWKAVEFWSTLNKYGGKPLYDVLSGGVWFIAGMVLFCGLWLGLHWSWQFSFAAIFTFEIYYWLDRLFFQFKRSNWPFILAISFAFILLYILILSSKPAKKYCSKRQL